ncbi:MAG: AAA family ATPase [Bacillota bacterium]
MEQRELQFETVGGRFGTWHLGRFLYWEQPLSRSKVTSRRLREKADRLVDGAAFLVLAAGWLSLIAWVYLNFGSIASDPSSLLTFFENRHPLLLTFFFSLWFDLFLFYRKSEASFQRQKINYRILKEENSKGKQDLEVSAASGAALRRTLEDSFLIAAKLKQTEVSVMHFFRALLLDPKVQEMFIRLGIDARALAGKVEKHMKGKQSSDRHPAISAALQQCLISAYADAFYRRQASIEPLNAVMFCYHADKLLAEILYDLEADADKIANACEWLQINRELAERLHSFSRSAALKPKGSMDRAYTAVASPTLDHFSHDLTLAAKYGRLELCVGRQVETDSIFEIMESGQCGVLLVGHSGSGKTSVINGIAQLMVEERVPKFLQDKRLVEIDVSRLVSGATAAEAESRLLSSISEASRAGNIVLHIANVENLVGISAGSEQSLDLSEVLAEALTRRAVYCLATISSANYAAVIEKSALGEAMTTVGIKEPADNQAIQMVESKVSSLEGGYGVFITYGAVEASVKLSQRFIHDKALPEKAVTLLRDAVIRVAKLRKHDPRHSICLREHVAGALSEKTGIPLQKLTEDEGKKLLSLEENIHQRMVGQEEAVAAVCASLRRARAEMKDAKRPIASFLFLGPTGVGKTELAKTVSEVYFGREDYMIRLDMSEYQDAGSTRKMIGDVDGTLGFLTEAVRKKPFSLILLDEIEKAHPDILNLFLQMLDDGRLTDGQGRTISFTESIIIATSNIGALYIQEQIKTGTDIKQIRQELIDNQLNKHMRPELINRFDGIIVFKPLTEENLYQIATLMLKGIKKRLAEKGVGLQADRMGAQKLAKAGYDPKFGARPLRRLLQEKVEDKIANKILAGELKRRDTVVIDAQAEIAVVKGKEL